jgi:hypothetical protein
VAVFAVHIATQSIYVLLVLCAACRTSPNHCLLSIACTAVIAVDTFFLAAERTRAGALGNPVVQTEGRVTFDRRPAGPGRAALAPHDTPVLERRGPTPSGRVVELFRDTGVSDQRWAP